MIDTVHICDQIFRQVVTLSYGPTDAVDSPKSS